MFSKGYGIQFNVHILPDIFYAQDTLQSILFKDIGYNLTYVYNWHGIFYAHTARIYYWLKRNYGKDLITLFFKF